MAEKVVKKSDVPKGGLAVLDVSGTRVAVANAAGKFYAFDDTCTHAQCSLGEGDLEGTKVICPCHGSEFDVTDGNVLTPPAREPVKSYRVREEGDSLRIET